MTKVDKYGTWILVTVGLIGVYYFKREETNEQSAALYVFVVILMISSVWIFSKLYQDFKNMLREKGSEVKTGELISQVVLFLILVVISTMFFGLYGIVVVTALPLALLCSDLVKGLFGQVNKLTERKK